MDFFYSFTETLLHSLWQSALAVLICACADLFIKNTHPLQKRNFLYGLLITQVALSVLTFIFYYTGNTIFGAAQQLYISGALIFGGLYRYADLIFYGYAAMLLFNIVRLIMQWAGFKAQYNRGLTRPSPGLKIFTELTSHHLGIKRKVSLWHSAHISSPLTFGMLKPVILLPLSLVNHISMAETEAIILHELAHIKSRDYLLNWFLLVTEMLYFFNPFIRIISKKIRLEREKNCDVQVINFNYPGILYAEALLKTARAGTMVKAFQLGAVRRSAQLLQRIEFFTAVPAFHKRRAGIASLFIPLFAGAALFFLPGVRKAEPALPSGAVAFTPAISAESPHAAIYPATYSNQKPAAVPVTANNVIAVTPAAASAAADEDAEDNGDRINTAAMQVGFNDTPDSVKEFTYKVETPQGIMTQSFRLTLAHGKWLVQPQWMVLETGPDSIRKAGVDTVFSLPQ